MTPIVSKESACDQKAFARGGDVFTVRKIFQSRSSCIYTSTVVFKDSPMIYGVFRGRNRVLQASRKLLILLALVMCWQLVAGFIAQAQDTSKQPPSNPNQQDAPPEAGGPQNDVGPYVVPKKKEEPPPPAPERPKKIDNMPDYSIKVDVPVVNLDVLVTSKDGQTIPGLRQENFRIFEDGAPQKISTFNQSKAPITAVLLVEFASTNYDFRSEERRVGK